ncbi:MAG TPA: hypothetical protein VGG49_13215 [Steroidobacteraceae bacterium]|jgi:hypothetical protein
MTVTITYVCDKCGEVEMDSDQFWKVGVTIQNYRNHHHGSSQKHEQQWCRKCVEAAHLLPPQQHKQQHIELPEPPTLEDLVREIAREEISDAAQS